MSTIRQWNLLGQSRVDVPHIRALESSIAGDFDLLAGKVLAGNQALVVTGFQVLTLGAQNAPASNLQVVVAGSVLLHPLASDSGTLFNVPNDTVNETLSTSNSKVIGGFVTSSVNYVGVDLRRSADPSTSDAVQFLNPNDNTENPKIVPLARTLDYVFVISTNDFTTRSTVCPIAKVTTDANNNVLSIQDARQFVFRLGSGGSNPSNTYSHNWANGRSVENTTALGDFTSGDKGISSFKEWANAVMTKLWEIGGGKRWYSPAADRNVQMVRTGSPLGNGEWFSWTTSSTPNNLYWTGIKFLFDNDGTVNSTNVWYNTVANQISVQAGLTDLQDGECIYVDLDRTQNATVYAQKGVTASLGMGSPPGSRQILAWRIGSAGSPAKEVWTRNASYPVDGVPAGTIPDATTNISGTLKASFASDSSSPVQAEPQMAATIAQLSGLKLAVAGGLTRTGSYIGVGDIIVGGQANDYQVYVKGDPSNTASRRGLIVWGPGSSHVSDTSSNDGTAIVALASSAVSNAHGIVAVGRGSSPAVLGVGDTGGKGVIGLAVSPQSISHPNPVDVNAGIVGRGSSTQNTSSGIVGQAGGTSSFPGYGVMGISNPGIDGSVGVYGYSGNNAKAMAGRFYRPMTIQDDIGTGAFSNRGTLFISNNSDEIHIEPGHPAQDKQYRNTITSANIIKCFGRVQVVGTAGNFSSSITRGFNIASVGRLDEFTVSVSLQSPFDGTSDRFPIVTANFIQGKIGDPNTLVQNKSNQDLIILSVVWFWFGGSSLYFQLLDKNGTVSLDSLKVNEGVHFTFMAVGEQQ